MLSFCENNRNCTFLSNFFRSEFFFTYQTALGSSSWDPFVEWYSTGTGWIDFRSNPPDVPVTAFILDGCNELELLPFVLPGFTRSRPSQITRQWDIDILYGVTADFLFTRVYLLGCQHYRTMLSQFVTWFSVISFAIASILASLLAALGNFDIPTALIRSSLYFLRRAMTSQHVPFSRH